MVLPELVRRGLDPQGGLRLTSAMDRTTPAAASLLRAVEATEAALRSTVLASVLGPRYDDRAYAGMRGVSVWLPIDAEDYQANGAWFAAARFYQAPEGAPHAASPWGAWLQELFSPDQLAMRRTERRDGASLDAGVRSRLPAS